MTLVKFAPGNNSKVFKTSYNDLFDSFFNTDQFLSKSIINRTPAVNILENEDEFLIEIAAPGLNKESFKINLEEDKLSVSAGEMESANDENANKKYNRREFNYAVFSRDFNLPETADSNKIYAEYKDGILNIRISKKEELKIQARAISIQ
ncbi:Hsp20/alpha crystallin family protein [Daejeonella sp.]|uniref:Hsp20/alpha crystallin family protein n=1 Tax=Daejeonella sp. TaxID=2805397 RepID=UPI0025B938DB|nr:Hsp20/alpha crystallin family protein [Daejeonella sp.]